MALLQLLVVMVGRAGGDGQYRTWGCCSGCGLCGNIILFAALVKLVGSNRKFCSNLGMVAMIPLCQ